MQPVPSPGHSQDLLPALLKPMWQHSIMTDYWEVFLFRPCCSGAGGDETRRDRDRSCASGSRSTHAALGSCGGVILCQGPGVLSMATITPMVANTTPIRHLAGVVSSRPRDDLTPCPPGAQAPCSALLRKGTFSAPQGVVLTPRGAVGHRGGKARPLLRAGTTD